MKDNTNKNGHKNIFRFNIDWKLYQDIASSMPSADKYNAISAELREKEIKTRDKYLRNLKEEITKLNHPSKICHLLLEEKGRLEEEIIEAKIHQKGDRIELLKSLIDDIVVPLYNLSKEKLEIIDKTNSFYPIEIKEKAAEVTTMGSEKGPELTQKPIDSENQNASVTESKSENDSKLSNEETNPELPLGFQKIKTSTTEENIRSYFMILSKEVYEKNGKPYMEVKDVEDLIKKNFLVFDDKPTGKYFDINLDYSRRARLRYFVYQFYLKYEYNSQNKIRYAYFLIHNFKYFKKNENELENFNSNLGKKPEIIIDIEKYFPKRQPTIQE